MTTHNKHQNEPKSGNDGMNLTEYPPIIELTTYFFFETIQNFENNHNLDKIYTDQTGQFPSRSRKGYNYVMIFYIYDINEIIGEPIKNRSDYELTSTYKRTLYYLVDMGLKPKVHWLDNEKVPGILKYDKDNMITYQLTPPNVHRANEY